MQLSPPLATLPEDLSQHLIYFAAENEKLGSIRPHTLPLVLRHGLFKALLPEKVGGLGYELDQACAIFEAVAILDGSLAWLLSLGTGANYFYGYYPESVALDLFSPADCVIAGSGAVLGTAQKINGGYWVHGRWAYCSGADIASLFTANCVVLNAKGLPSSEVKSFTFRPKDVRILRDWDAFGMKATASHSIQVTGAFVPDDWVFDLKSAPKAHAPKFCHLNFVAYAQACFTAVTLGLYQGFLNQWPRANLRHAGYEQASEQLENLRQRFYAYLQKQELQLSFSDLCSEIAERALEHCTRLFTHLGMAAISERSGINRTWRDLQTAARHVYLRRY